MEYLEALQRVCKLTIMGMHIFTEDNAKGTIYVKGNKVYEGVKLKDEK